MIFKILLSAIIFYFLVLFQSSFLVHFAVWGITPNLILLLVVFWNIFEDSKKKLGIYVALAAGFLLDVFSNRIIGFNIFILGTSAVFLKIIFYKYVRFPFRQI